MKRLLIVLFSLVALIGYSQEIPKSKKTLKADEAFSFNELTRALELYKGAFQDSDSKLEKAYINFQEGEIHRLTLDYKKAITKYKAAIQKNYPDPKANLYLATMLQAVMIYDEALAQYRIYNEKSHGDSLARMGIRSCEASVEWMKNPTRYQITNLKEVNSKGSDFAPAYANSLGTEVMFSSSREIDGFTKINKATGQFYTSIFEIYQNRAGEWEELKPLNDTINTRSDNGSPSFTADYNSMFFTRCKSVKDVFLGCQIYEGKRRLDEHFFAATYVPLVADSLSVGQPSISADGLTLYFASDMPGGYGGRDIWMATREGVGSMFGKPIHMGPIINTVGNELYPYIHTDGTLYFSSDYHPGMGGLDVFRALPKGESWVIFNMKFPINSSADDFGIVFKKGKEEGLFSSSRKTTEIPNGTEKPFEIKAKGRDDIYTFVLPVLEFSLTGTVVDGTSKKTLPNAIVQIFGDDGSEITIQTSEEGRFKYTLKKDVEYIYLVKKEGYLFGKGKVSTMDLDKSEHFKQQIALSELGQPIEIANTFYEFGKWTLTEGTKKELEKLVDILNENPNITIELASHTDMIGDEASNQILSQKRAQSVVDFLIEKGIDAERLTAKGYGKSKPQTVSAVQATNGFFKEGTVLTPEFVESLTAEDEVKTAALKEEANKINRRTEFKVLSTRYIPNIE